MSEQIATDPRFAAARAYVAEVLQPGSTAALRLAGLAAGVTERVDLADGSFALDQVYVPRARPDGFFESHRRYIDVQVIVAGEELMEVSEISRLTVTETYNADRDFLKYGDVADAAVLRMRAGDAAVFFPQDGHMPSLRWRDGGVVRKTVVKVPVGA